MTDSIVKRVFDRMRTKPLDGSLQHTEPDGIEVRYCMYCDETWRDKKHSTSIFRPCCVARLSKGIHTQPLTPQDQQMYGDMVKQGLIEEMENKLDLRKR